jgi:hypothetical protein
MLNRLQRHTKCTPGYCEQRKKGTGETFCCFGFPKTYCEETQFVKEATRDFADIEMISF